MNAQLPARTLEDIKSQSSALYNYDDLGGFHRRYWGCACPPGHTNSNDGSSTPSTLPPGLLPQHAPIWERIQQSLGYAGRYDSPSSTMATLLFIDEPYGACLTYSLASPVLKYPKLAPIHCTIS